jgi:hypothetical protein
MSTPTKWTPAKLDEMRLVGDPTADAVIAALDDKEENAVSRLFGQIMRTDDPVPKALPDPAERYFEVTAVPPSWADDALVREGEEVFAKYGVELTAALFCAALPQCYAAEKGVFVLTATGRMHGHGLERRVLETAQFLVDIVDEGGLSPKGRGVRSAQKVRLMHAGVREMIRQNAKRIGFDEAERGAPICQADLAYTLMTFSYVMLEALSRLGLTLTAREKEAWVHCWRVAGHYMGVLDENNPVDYADARAFSEAYRGQCFGASPEGRELTRSLMNFMKRNLPGRVFDGIPAALIRQLNGDALADLLAVEKTPWTSRVIRAETHLFHTLDTRLPGGLRLRPGLGNWFDELIRMIAVVRRGGKQAEFRIPNTLSAARRGVRRRKERA